MTSPEPDKHEQGYTLVELLVVIAIAGLVTTAVPALAGQLLPSARFNAEFEELKGSLARTRALARGSGSDLAFDMEPWGEAVLFEPSDLSSSDSDKLVFFGADGATGGRLIFSKGERSKALEVDWLTGRALEVEPPE